MKPDWTEALCADIDDPDVFFPTITGHNRDVSKICGGCGIATACRDYARTEGIPFGVWGGETGHARHDWWTANGGRPKDFSQVLDDWIERTYHYSDEYLYPTDDDDRDAMLIHGRASSYTTGGCRCLECTRAKRDEQRLTRSRRAAG